MAETTTTIGRCPRCSTDLPRSALLIEYVRDDGGVGRYAVCRSCDDVVHPA